VLGALHGDGPTLAAAWRGLFRAPPPTKQQRFDAVVHLDPRPRVLELPRARSTFKNLRRTESVRERVGAALFGFDAAREFVERLAEAGLTRFVDVFAGARGSGVSGGGDDDLAPCYVGLAWRRDVVEGEVEFSVPASQCAEPCGGPADDEREDEDEDDASCAAVPVRRVRVSKAQVLDEVARVGAGLAVRVDVWEAP